MSRDSQNYNNNNNGLNDNEDKKSPFDDSFEFETDTLRLDDKNLFEEMVIDSDDGDDATNVDYRVGSSAQSNDMNINSSSREQTVRDRQKSRRFNSRKTMKAVRETMKETVHEFKDVYHTDNADTFEIKNRENEFRSIYFNLPLPDDMLDEDDMPILEYPRNKIRTTKYTPITFLPKNIMLQFNNFANIYFLILVIMGAFQIFGVSSPGLASVPLIVIVILTSIKDGFEDSRRTLVDMQVNNTKTYILEGIENGNVPYNHVSYWRRFKKANTKLMIKLMNYINETFTSSGKEARKQRHIKEKQLKRMGKTLPRSSLDTIGEGRFSGEYLRPSLNEHTIDSNLLGKNQDSNFLDFSMPIRDDCKFKRNYWKNTKVGDIIRIHNNDEVPADVAIISSSNEDGICYVETKNLDGETNLKIREALKCSSSIKTSRDISRTKFWIESEGPHANLYTYQGNMKWIDPQDRQMKNEAITINNTLLRGCTLRNTKWAMGIVLFTGDDTKIMLNSGVTPTKKSRISRELNFSVLINFIVVFILCLIAALVNGVYYSKEPSSRDFFEFGTVAGSPGLNGFVSFWVALILYQSLVPISLYISIEIIKTCQAIFIYFDVLLYYDKIDYPCTVKSWSISDDLGQVEYIFSDKTGTLTQNVMEFKKCTVNGVSYGRAYTEALAGLRKRQGIDVEEEARIERAAIKEDREVMIDDLQTMCDNSQFYPDEITFVSKNYVKDLQGENGEMQQKCCEHFMLAIALCHTALIERNESEPTKLEIKAQSPDETALVTTARDLGYSFVDKTKTGYIVEVSGVQKEFEILNILEFNSTRKRMSCIVKIPQGEGQEPKALLLCKGADSVVYSRLSHKAGVNNSDVLEKTAQHLEQYATEGLRTLCIAQKEISWSDYLAWNEKYKVAASALANREDKLMELYDVIEQDMILLGGTAIEDKLQDGVPESIAMLGKAGIKLWVLTGDKVETAINIGFSCNVLNNDMELLVLKTDGEDVKEYGSSPHEVVTNLIVEYLQSRFGMTGSEEELKHAKDDHSLPTGEFAIIIDGEALKFALNDDDLRRKFLLLCKNCKAVLCCRVSPAQKAAVVKMVKNGLDVMTLAIGDGSNDVAMIQSADVGVGIAGEEGRQAVMCSDFAIGQFRFLTRLLLVHGRWSYKRLAEMVPQFFFKNVIFTFALFWNGIYNDFDGSYLFEFTYLTFYNLAFTSVPVIVLGIFDQDVSAKISMAVPQLYISGILRKDWNQYRFLWYMFDGVYESVISYFFPYLLYRANNIVTQNGLGLDHRFFVGVPITGICVFAANLHILMEQGRWDWFSGLFIFLSIIVYIGWTGIWSSSLNSYEFFKAGARVFNTPTFWAVLFVGTFFCLVPRFFYDCVQKLLYPNDIDIVREMWHKGHFDKYPEDYDPTDPNAAKIDKLHRYDVSNEANHTEYDFTRNSQDSLIVEEYPLHDISPNGKEKDVMIHRDEGSSLSNSENIHMRTAANIRTSFQGNRMSLELPGMTRATSLLSK